jgi:imidazolonepropionase-like amidohydrolase
METGKVADMVVLDADPLDHIKNTQRIAGVVIDGMLSRHLGLDRLLLEAEQLASQD